MHVGSKKNADKILVGKLLRLLERARFK